MGHMPVDAVPAKSVKSCPICGKPRVPEFRPFCSRRCADVDLNRWLSGAYVVPGRAEDDEDGASATDSDGRERP